MKKRLTTTHAWLLCALILLCIATIAYMDLVVRPPYFVKTAVKAPIFFCVPLVYALFCKDFKPFSVLKPQKEGLRMACLLGLAIYVVVLGTYLIANGLVDLSGIRQSLEQNLGIDQQNFIYIGLYVSICNSFLEEWFFRGFVFHRFKTISRGLGYLVSSTAFAIYHIAIMDGMFGWELYLLVLAGLFAGGTIFNYLNERHNSIYPSWFCHFFANFAMNTIGFFLFF